ncbi:hypothetical protein AB8A05_03940 [Tardiphaga sp. 538_B7_N1_4]|uniref:hypothetical protein n=1 Tax=Tardiphaga sp. 538_B7_N1_4 TaxID=3240778 RepID=UPI003F2067EA
MRDEPFGLERSGLLTVERPIEADIISRLLAGSASSRDPEGWHSLCDAAAAEISKLRAEIASTASDMRERCAKVADSRVGRLREKAKRNNRASNATHFAQAVEAANIAASIRAVSLIATTRATPGEGQS